MKKRVAIQQATDSRGATGQVIKTWATVATVWAGIEPIKGDERVAQQGIEGAISHRVYLRHNAFPSLTSKNRLLYAGRVFEIRGAINAAEAGREWVLDCREIVP
ncbi:MAG: phage head closure protein [Parcubacteria group bacterium]